MPEPTRERVEGEWRCSACGHGEHLSAWAQSNVSGKLLPDGSVEESYSDQHTLFEESIECGHHLAGPGSAQLERWFGGAWTRWTPCDWTEVDERFKYPETYTCIDGRRMRGRVTDHGPCPKCDGAGGRWLPVEEPCHAA